MMSCSICLTKNKLPKQIFCKNNHEFHVECIKELKQHSNQCPLCREELYPIKTYNLRITENTYKNIIKRRWNIKEYSDVIKYTTELCNKIGKSEHNKKCIYLFELYTFFINNYKYISLHFTVFESIRVILLKLISEGTNMYKDCIEQKYIKFMLQGMIDNQLTYTYAIS